MSDHESDSEINCATDNGCMCTIMRSEARNRGRPKPKEWTCYVCQVRLKNLKLGSQCEHCGVGLLFGESINAPAALANTKALCTQCAYRANGW